MKSTILALALLSSIAAPSFAQDNAIKGLYAGMPIEEFKDKVTAMGGSFTQEQNPEVITKNEPHAYFYNMEHEVTVGGARVEGIIWRHNYDETHSVVFALAEEDRKTAREAVYAKYGRHDNYTPRTNNDYGFLYRTETYTWHFDNNNRLEMTSYGGQLPSSIHLVRDDVKDGDKNDF